MTGGTNRRRAASFLELLDLRATDTNTYVSMIGGPADPPTSSAIYGGQLGAQALRAAGLTVPLGRIPHSFRCMFIQAGRRFEPVTFTVDVDRDGTSFSARRVSAWQDGQLLCTVMAGFVQPRSHGWTDQREVVPAVKAPTASSAFKLGNLLSFEGRNPDPPDPAMDRPGRFWARAIEPMRHDALIQACALTYLSDVASGTSLAPDDRGRPRASLDHTVWFHDRVDVRDWLLFDLVHEFTGFGRSFYQGRVFDASGRRVASLAQEELFS